MTAQVGMLGDQIGKGVANGASLDLNRRLLASVLAQGGGDLDLGHRLYMMPQDGQEIQPVSGGRGRPPHTHAHRSLYFDLFTYQLLVVLVTPRQLERISQRGLAFLYAGDDVRAAEPVRLRQIGLRPLSGMVRMRVIETDDVLAVLAAVALDANQFLRIDVVAVVSGIGSRVAGPRHRSHATGAVLAHLSKQHAAALVGIRFFTVLSESFVFFATDIQHQELNYCKDRERRETEDSTRDKGKPVLGCQFEVLSRTCVISAFFPEPFTQIFVAGIAEDGHKHGGLTTSEPLCYLQATHNRGGRRNPDQQSFFAGQSNGHPVRVFGRNAYVLIGQLRIINVWDDGARHVLGSFDPVE